MVGPPLPNCDHRSRSPSSQTTSDTVVTDLPLPKDGHKDTALATRNKVSGIVPDDVPKRSGWYLRLLNTVSNGFCLEIISCISSITLTLVLILLLFLYDDRGLPSWPMGITLNAIVSLLVTAAKSMLLLAVGESISQYKWLYYKSSNHQPLNNIQTFDSASRGPWGAMRMMSIRPRSVVSLGCLVTVLCLALDPFGQQVLVYQTRMTQTGRASVASTIVYNGPSNDTFASVESPMLQAIYAGILDEGTTQLLDPFCATGNCTFNEFESLGFCSECCDVAPYVRRNCKTAGESTTSCSYTFPGDISVPFNNSKPLKLMEVFSIPLNVSIPYDASTCSIEALGNSVAAIGMVEVRPDGDIPLMKSSFFCALFPCVQKHSIKVQSGVPFSTILGSWCSSSDNEYIGNQSTTPAAIVIKNSGSRETQTPTTAIRARSTSISSELPRIIMPAGGVPVRPANTTLIQIGFNDRLSYSAVVSNTTLIVQIFNNMTSLLAAPLGLTTNEIVMQYVQPYNTFDQLGYITTLAMMYFPTAAISRLRLLLLNQSSSNTTSAEDLAAQSLLLTVDYSLSQIPFSDPLATTSTPNSDAGPDATVPSYTISQKRFFALNAWFANTFTGTVSQSYDLFRGSIYELDQITASSDLMSVIYNHGNLTKTMQNLATSMSNYIRSSGPAQDAVEGAEMGLETYVHVRWGWLSLLVACVVMGLMFLISTILSTKKQTGGVAWKSSVLALLFRGLDDDEHRCRSRGHTQPRRTACVVTKLISEMEVVAQSLLVRLEEDDDGTLKLRRQVIPIDETEMKGTR